MEKLFLTVFNMSITACFVICATLIVRFALKSAPKKYSYALWLATAFRLACPVSAASVLSLFNLGIFDFKNISHLSGTKLEYLPEYALYDAEPTIFTGISVPEYIMSNSVDLSEIKLPEATPMYSANPMQIITYIASLIWLVGVVLMLAYAVISFIRIKLLLHNAVLEGEKIYCSERVTAPFILGILRPRIYLPSGLEGDARRYVLAHEHRHIKRGDHLVKLLSFLLLCVHWFNPFCWVAFSLMTRDMEMSCDEWVLSADKDIKKAYSSTLLSFASKKVMPLGPLGFGESSVSLRIKNILKWRQMSKWTSVPAIILIAVILISCTTNPSASKRAGDIFGLSFNAENLIYEDIYSAFTYSFTGYTDFNVTSDGLLLENTHTADNVTTRTLGDVEDIKLTKQNFDRMFDEGNWYAAQSAEGLRKTARLAWRIEVKNSDKNDYYLILQCDSNTYYLAYGYYSAPLHLGEAGKDKAYIQWMFTLKPQQTPSRLYAAECMYEDPLKGTDFDGFCYDYYFTANEFSIITLNEKNILSAEISEGWKSLEYNDEQWLELFNEKEYAPDISEYNVRQQLKLSNQYVLLNMDGNFWIMKLYTESYGRVRASGIYRLSYASRGMTLTDTASDGALTQLISETILNQYRSQVPETLIYHESHKIFDIETVYGDPKKGSGEKVKLTKVYLELLYGAFGFVNGELCDMHYGGHTPAVLTFKVNESDHYECIAFEEPESGNKYVNSVKELFPEHLHEQALDASDDSFLSLKQSSYKKAIEATATDPNPKIERLINVIMSSPLTSSVPADYIDANQIEYRELLYLGEYTLKYICESFKEGEKRGLEGHIMRALLDELTFNEIKISDPEYKLETGQDYFDEWAKELKNLAQKMPNGELQAKFPALWQSYHYIYD